MLPDNEELTGATFRLIPEKPLQARYVRFKITNKRIIDVTEVEILDAIALKPFDLRIALPDDKQVFRATGSSHSWSSKYVIYTFAIPVSAKTTSV